MRNSRSHFVFFTALVACLMFGMGQLFAAPPSSGAESVSRLSGFVPDSAVTYKILSPAGILFEGAGSTDKGGALSLSHPSLETYGHDYVVYDFEIQNAGQNDALNVLIRVNNKTGRIIASGTGTQEFSDIAITTPSQNIRTRADWAGLFRGNARMGTRSDAPQEFRIALHGVDAFRAPGYGQKNPQIIEVLTATGGGNAGSGGVNEFIPSTNQELSTSNEENVRTSTKRVTENYVRGMMLMTEQLSAVAMQQMLQIGQFFDAKQQLEVQRLHQQLKAEAVKDYHPSEQMCRVGSFMRSVAKSEQKAEADKRIINEIMATRVTNEFGGSTSEGFAQDVEARLKQFREVYCDVQDNNKNLDFMCDHQPGGEIAPNALGATDKRRVNKDIDFIRTLEFPHTLEVDFAAADKTNDEEDIIALAKNLYWIKPLRAVDPKELPEEYPAFLDVRRLTALNSIAHNSFATLAGMKAHAEPATGNKKPGWTFMKTFLRDFGLDDEKIDELVGQRPSYWAQMDIMTKKIYQNPDFYTELYSKPANVERMSVALDAIKLMQIRDHFDSSLRREMISSAMIENELSKHYEAVESILASRGK